MRSLIRQRSLYRLRLWVIIAAVLGSTLFLLWWSGELTNLIFPNETYNRTWWEAKSYPKKRNLPKCHTPGANKHNISLLNSLKKALDVPEGPPPDRNELCSMSFEDLEMYYHTIQNDFSIDDEISSVFKCEVHSFDPSMHQTDHLHKPSVFFHATGLSDYNGVSKDMAGWKMRTMEALRKELNHVERAPDVIKMDIESWEWSVIPDVLKTSQLMGVKQFLVEFHAKTDRLVKEYWVHKLLILRDLYLEGYRVFWVGRNHLCTYKSPVFNRVLYGCYEVSFVNIKSNTG